MVKASINLSKVQSSLKKLSKDLNKTASETITEVAIIGSRQLATRIEPFGLTKKAETISKGAVLKDMSKVYYDTGHAYNVIKQKNKGLAVAYASAIHKNEIDKAEDIARKVITGFEVERTDSGEHLESQRNSKGRVDEGIPMGLGDKNSLKELKEKKQATAGLAKAAWLQSGISLGGKTRMGKWLKKKSGLGNSKKRFFGLTKYVILINRVQYAHKLLTQAKINSAILNSFRNQRTRMTKQLAAITKKF